MVELSELTAYAAEKYGIRAEPDRSGDNSLSVLHDPETGRPIAFLMQRWDTDSGTMRECCDLKCGAQPPLPDAKPYLSRAVRMQSERWINIAFDSATEPDVVYGLFDRAVSSGRQHGFTIVIDPTAPFPKTAYSDTPIPFADSGDDPAKKIIPQRLRQLRRMFSYGRETMRSKAESFFRQAVFMKDYEDDVPWEGEFFCYYPTYSDLTTSQLRGYFTWRARVRRGEYLPIPCSAAYIYIYELLNGIGASSPEDSLRKLKELEDGFIGTGAGNEQMRKNLHRWSFELAVINGLPPDVILNDIAPDIARTDASLLILNEPVDRSDEEIADALGFIGGKKYENAVKNYPDKAAHLFSKVWRNAVSVSRRQGQDVFARCFGIRRSRYWYPLENTLYFDRGTPGSRTVKLGECRTYEQIGGMWYETSFNSICMDSKPFQGLLHETDALLRRHFRTGHYLKESKKDKWAEPYVTAVINELIEAEKEAARPKISIDLSGLEKIRSDALVTRDSLLTEEEIAEMNAADTADIQDEDAAVGTDEGMAGIGLDAVHIAVLRRLLRGEPADDIIKENRIMPSIAADAINEALYDEIGDTVLECEDDTLTVVEDYREDVIRLLGGL